MVSTGSCKPLWLPLLMVEGILVGICEEEEVPMQVEIRCEIDTDGCSTAFPSKLRDPRTPSPNGSTYS